MPTGAVRVWARRIPWHNWIFAGYYLFFGLMGVCALIWTPTSIQGAAGPWVTVSWAVASLLVAAVGIVGALRPNFRWEVCAGYAGILAVFLYASTVQLIILLEWQPTRSPQFWAIAAHVWMFALRLVYIHLEVRKKTTPTAGVSEE